MAAFDNITGFVAHLVSEPVSLGWVIFGVLLLFVVLLSVKHFLDIAVDIWKIPFAIVVDALDLLAFDNGFFDVFAAIAGFILFWVFAKRGHHISKLFGIVVAAEALIGIWILPEYAFITNLLPLATLAMFVFVWSD